jgi:hypothetical protein
VLEEAEVVSMAVAREEVVCHAVEGGEASNGETRDDVIEQSS